jgi:hypothetical protein
LSGRGCVSVSARRAHFSLRATARRLAQINPPSADKKRARYGLFLFLLPDGRHAYWLAASAGAAAGAEAPFFTLAFFGFFTCFSVGGEYELTALDCAGAAGCCASVTEAPQASESPVNISVNFFIRFFSVTVASH